MQSKLLLIILSIALVLSCDSPSPIRSNVPVSENMEHFLNMINGNQKEASDALLYYGADEKIRYHDMSLYELKNPIVTYRKDETYLVLFKCGITTREYEITWSENQIIEIFDHGIQ